MQYGQTQPNDPRSELLNYLRYHAPAAEGEHRLVEINELVQYSQDLEQSETRKAKRSQGWFLAFGVLLLAMGAGALVSTILGMEADPYIAFGVMGMLAAGVFSLARLQSNPLDKLHDRMSKLHARLVKPERQAKPKGIFRSRRDKIIAGVAGGLARRLGVKPAVLRLLFLISIGFTSGFSILLYLVLAVGLSFLPADEERL